MTKASERRRWPLCSRSLISQGTGSKSARARILPFVDHQSVSKVRVVLQWASELAQAVLLGPRLRLGSVSCPPRRAPTLHLAVLRETDADEVTNGTLTLNV
jgi:hypothetical protein